MPIINVKLIEGVFAREQKREMIRLTDAMVSVEGERLRPVTWVVVEEVQAARWASAASRWALKTSRPSRPACPPRRPAANHGRGDRRSGNRRGR